MSHDANPADARVDRALAGVALDVPPDRDLWPVIAAGLEPHHSGRSRWPLAAAAAVLLVAASSLITVQVMRRSAPSVAAVAPPATTETETPHIELASFGPGHSLSPEYAAARQQLATMLARRIDGLPDSARQKVEHNLGELRRAADEINAALALQPGDALLEELLLNTYQDELAVLASVNQLASLNGTAVPEDEGIKL